MENTQKFLIGIADVRHEWGTGRDLTTRLFRLMPYIKIGNSGRGEVLKVKRADFERLIDRAAAERVDLWELAKQHTPESLQAWLTPQIEAGVN